jgi:hypothetical protein
MISALGNLTEKGAVGLATGIYIFKEEVSNSTHCTYCYVFFPIIITPFKIDNILLRSIISILLKM